MKTHFYNRSAVILFDEPPLPSFLLLDDKFDHIFEDHKSSLVHPAVQHANNIARRYYDIRYFKFQLDKFQKHDIWSLRGELCATHLVVCIGAFKSLLDAVAICLNDLFSLNLSPREQDFRKKKFWNHLRANAITKGRFDHLHTWMKTEVPEWRDSAIHRYSPEVVSVSEVRFNEPTVVTHMNQILENFPPEPRMRLQMNISSTIEMNLDKTIPPGHFIENWLPHAEDVCSIICELIPTTLTKANASS